ncbi:MAG: hypothetical protein AAFY76_14005 [Cyanobacteria bacterium J06649_11]
MLTAATVPISYANRCKYEGKYEWRDRFLSWSGEEEADGLELDRSAWREIEL